MIPAALGFRVHSGWAALVAVAGSFPAPEILDQRRIEIADPHCAGSKQPYHAAERLKLEDAEKWIARCTESSTRLAEQCITSALQDLASRGFDVITCAVSDASGRPLPALAATLASHALIHTAEGEFFRNVIASVCAQYSLVVTRIKEKELLARASTSFALGPEKLQSVLSGLGRSLGPPWTQDQKFATLLACLALVPKTAIHSAG